MAREILNVRAACGISSPPSAGGRALHAPTDPTVASRVGAGALIVRYTSAGAEIKKSETSSFARIAEGGV